MSFEKSSTVTTTFEESADDFPTVQFDFKVYSNKIAGRLDIDIRSKGIKKEKEKLAIQTAELNEEE